MLLTRRTVHERAPVLAPLAAIVALYLIVFVVPHCPVYQFDSSPIFLHEAQRMAEGQVIYRDFFEPLFPGTQYVFLGLIKLFGVQNVDSQRHVHSYRVVIGLGRGCCIEADHAEGSIPPS